MAKIGAAKAQLLRLQANARCQKEYRRKWYASNLMSAYYHDNRPGTPVMRREIMLETQLLHQARFYSIIVEALHQVGH